LTWQKRTSVAISVDPISPCKNKKLKWSDGKGTH
jgi:hypothetical protein